MRVLFAEDDEAVGRATAASLTAAGFVVDLVESRGDALHALKSHRYDAAVFDILLADGSGLEALAEARRSGLDLPVLLLTALDSVDDRVTGLNAGADDYLVKPFAVDELIARLRALQRRLGTAVTMALAVENASFDPTSRMLTVNGGHVPLSRAEAIVVERFMRCLGLHRKRGRGACPPRQAEARKQRRDPVDQDGARPRLHHGDGQDGLRGAL